MAKSERTCDLCNAEIAINQIQVREGYVLATTTAFVAMGARVREACVPCLDAIKFDTSDSAHWAERRALAVLRIAAEAARIAADDRAAADAAEAKRLAAEDAARLEAERVAAAQAARAEEFAKLSPDAQLKTALASLLDGTASTDEREMFAKLVKG